MITDLRPFESFCMRQNLILNRVELWGDEVKVTFLMKNEERDRDLLYSLYRLHGKDWIEKIIAYFESGQQ